MAAFDLLIAWGSVAVFFAGGWLFLNYNLFRNYEDQDVPIQVINTPWPIAGGRPGNARTCQAALKRQGGGSSQQQLSNELHTADAWASAR